MIVKIKISIVWCCLLWDFKAHRQIAVQGVDGCVLYSKLCSHEEWLLFSLVPVHLKHYLLAVTQSLSNVCSVGLDFGLITEHLA